MPDASIWGELEEQAKHLGEVVRREGVEFTEYDTGGTGHAYGVRTYRNGMVSGQRVFMTAGTAFQPHVDDEFECGFLYRGSFRLKIGDDVDKIVKAPYAWYVRPGQLHSGEMITDCLMIMHTSPPSESFP